jgi:glycosyltransferase involved in cell wall biosynthesis
VLFTGYLTGQRLRQALGESRFTVLPSEWYEVFGLSLLESFAVSRPVVAAHIGGIPELVENEVDGLLFSSRDQDALASSIQRMWDQSSVRREMGRRGQRKVATHFDAPTHYEKLLPIYENLAGL